jgi:ApbE superfamily uncharacterized protein (UPF0280 family)
MKKYHIEEGESIITLLCNKKMFFKIAVEELRVQRDIISTYISKYPIFNTSLKPLDFDNDAPVIVKKMFEASNMFNVGPMASVAGAISESIALKLIEFGADEIIVDNGGDIAMFLKSPRIMGLYTGNSNISGYGFNIDTVGKLLGVCTSSGKMGHSKSFGISYTTTVFSDSPTIADSAATRIGNNIKDDNPDSIQTVLENENNIGNKISGIVAITKNYLGKIGNIPEIIKTNNNFSLITRG